MAIRASQVQIGEFFMTATDQLRKVTELDKDDQGRDRVHYLSKSGRIPARKFEFGHNKSAPPLLGTFVNDCDRLLSAADVAQLRAANIVLTGE